MKTYEFDIILKDISEFADDHADALFDARCDDGTLTSRDEVTWVHYDRQAASLEEAIRTGVTQFQSTGFTVSKVELDVTAAISV